VNKKVLSVVACLCLAACGGHSNSGSVSSQSNSAGTGSSNTGTGGSGTTSTTGNSGTSTGTSALTQTYEALSPPTDATTFLTQLNTEGAKGFRYVVEEAFSGDGNATQNIFVKDSAATYSYDLPTNESAQSDFLTQANQEGAKGYRYEGPLAFGALYMYRSDAASSVYQYAATAEPTSESAFLASADAEGASGFWYYGPLLLGSTSAALFIKDTSSTSTYTYDALTVPTTDADFVSQANGEGAKGYRYKGGFAFGTDSVEAYIKDVSQSPSFTYQSQAFQTTSAAFIQQANAQGAQSAGWLANLVFGTDADDSYYFSATNCSGFLCSTLNTFTQN
jgi:hypothetical protein